MRPEVLLPLEAAGDAPMIERARRFLQPGHIFVAAKPATVTTILGSCVAVCLWDAQRRIGGLNHFLLPHPAAGVAASARFGNVAMELLVTSMREAGARIPFLRARVFGGACMFPQMQSSAHLGVKNAELALDDLARRGIEVVEAHTGGNRGRKLIFNTDEGKAWLTTI